MSSSSNQPTGSRITATHIALLAVIIVAVAVALGRMPVEKTETSPFASPAFQNTWMNEASAATRAVDLWGGEPLASRVEPYVGAPNNRRVVQYFERGRMEVESGANEVTQGKLALEIVTGEIDLGGNVRLEREPPALSIDSGEPEDRVPTWQTLAALVSDQDGGTQATSRDRIVTWIGRDGVYDGGAAPEMRRLDQYVEETGFYLPDVTADLFGRPEFQNERWVESFGYPISDPYWTHYRRYDRIYPALIQVFERRVLVHTPDIEDSRAFTVPSIGRHYSIWRYGTEPSSESAWTADEAQATDLTLGNNLDARVYATGIGTPVDLTLSASGHLMILNAEGEILIAESLDPDATPDDFTVWLDGIEDPQGITTIGETVVVTAAGRVEFYVDRDGAGVQTDSDSPLLIPAESSPPWEVRGKPVRTSDGSIFSSIEEYDGRQKLRAVGDSTDVLHLHDFIAVPGPIEFSGGDLLLSGRHEDERAGVLLIPSVTTTATTPTPQPIGAFPTDMTIRAIAVADEDHWPISELGDVLVAVEQDESARLYTLSRSEELSGDDEADAIELAGGLSRPTAIEIGLDGSIYVADAGTGRVIRIQYID